MKKHRNYKRIVKTHPNDPKWVRKHSRNVSRAMAQLGYDIEQMNNAKWDELRALVNKLDRAGD